MFLGFEYLPKRWGKRKVSENFQQAKFADEGKGILIITYAMKVMCIHGFFLATISYLSVLSHPL
ncbi:hypothetical protein [Bacillus cereus group sp. MYBK35-2]|uniref:hypothetical protein n=1 Tax=unclassified Bacillus cereus group TaxID=2750818 RepID=UPI0029EDCA44|nr:hypothetical protein [Bacillus cereus]MDA2319538.1 hypothetical protein [Bacillus cereus]MDA2502797.1 hypothetical protein [Bacillus cereus]